MATTFRNSVIKNIGKKPVEIINTDASTRSTVIGLSVANLTASNVYVSVLVKDDTSVTGYYIKDVLVPTNTSLRALNGGEKLILAPSNALYVSSDVDDSIDVIASFVEIT